MSGYDRKKSDFSFKSGFKSVFSRVQKHETDYSYYLINKTNVKTVQ